MQQAGTLMRRAAIASVSVSLFLVAIKTFAYFASHSVAMLASLADSALDLFTSSLNLFAIRQALTPADAEHRFGHGKAEPLAGLAQGAFISASALFLVIQAVNRILAPEPIEHSIAALVVMCVAIACAIGLILYERKVVAKTGSLAVEADQTHYFGDLVTNIGVVVALLLSSGLGWTLADPLIAIAVAGVMLFTALRRGPPELQPVDGPRTAGRRARPHLPHRRRAMPRSRMCMISRPAWRGFPPSSSCIWPWTPKCRWPMPMPSAMRWSRRCWKPIPARR